MGNLFQNPKYKDHMRFAHTMCSDKAVFRSTIMYKNNDRTEIRVVPAGRLMFFFIIRLFFFGALFSFARHKQLERRKNGPKPCGRHRDAAVSSPEIQSNFFSLPK